METGYVHFKMKKEHQAYISERAKAEGVDKWLVISNLMEGGIKMAKAKKVVKKATTKKSAKKC